MVIETCEHCEHREYTYRDFLLRRHGYRNYTHYLFSDVWAVKRDHALAIGNGKCDTCGKCTRSVNARHIDYSDANLVGDSLEGIVLLCKKCNQSVFWDRGRLRPLFNARQCYTEMVQLKAERDENLYKKGYSKYCTVCGKKAKKKSQHCGPCKVARMKEMIPKVPPITTTPYVKRIVLVCEGGTR